MDSVSQFVLGAAIAEATLGSRLGRKAMLLGGLLGTLPDLDVLVHYSDAVESFTYHRSWSHSLFVLSLASLPIAWLLQRYWPSRWLKSSATQAIPSSPPSYGLWFMCVFFALTTHPLLDGFTVYGTQLLWPLPVKPVAWGSVFIIDPLYTLPLIFGLIVAYRNRRAAKKAVLLALLLSTVYLGATLAIQQHVRARSLIALQQQNLGSENVLVAPTPLSLLWRVVSMDDDQYYEGFTSLLDQSNDVRFESFASNRALIDSYVTHWPIARLDWFTSGMISADKINDELIINDLRMGIESSYIFRFLVGRLALNEFVPLESVQLPVVLDYERMRKLLRRTWDEQVRLD